MLNNFKLMHEDGKHSDSVKINISSSSNPKHKNLKDYLKSEINDHRSCSEDTMHIYIKRKANKKIINVNLSEQSGDNEKIHIKIEKEKVKRNVVGECSSPKKTYLMTETEVINLTSAPSLRKDAHGTIIEKGNAKKYKLTFLDIIQRSKNFKNFDRSRMKEKFIDSVRVESFKSYNNDNDEERDWDHEKTNCKCGCVIF